MQSIFGTFTQLLPTLIDLFTTYLDSIRKSTRGRPRSVDFNLFFKAFYSNVRDSTTPSNFKYYFGIPKSTYFYYLKLLKQSCIFTTLEQITLNNYSFDSTLLVDTCTVKSHNGTEGVGASNTDRGRNGIKVQVISDLNGLIYSLETCSANRHDSKIFQNTTFSQPFTTPTDILMDSAYVGKPVKLFAQTHNLQPIVVPKRTTNGNFTHSLDTYQSQKIKQRWQVERHISILRRFKAISNKYVKTLSTFKLYLSFAKLLINTFHLGHL